MPIEIALLLTVIFILKFFLVVAAIFDLKKQTRIRELENERLELQRTLKSEREVNRINVDFWRKRFTDLQEQYKAHLLGK